MLPASVMCITICLKKLCNGGFRSKTLHRLWLNYDHSVDVSPLHLHCCNADTSRIFGIREVDLRPKVSADLQ